MRRHSAAAPRTAIRVYRARLALARARARRGPAADLSRSAAERSDARRCARELERHAGARAAGALGAACRASARPARVERERRLQQHVAAIRRSVSSTGTSAASNFSISASQPLYRAQNVVAPDQAKRQVEQADYTLAVGAAGPDHPRDGRLLRRAARRGQRRAGRERRRRRCPSSSRRRSATSRSASRRSPTPTRRRRKLRLDRRAGDHRAQRPRQPAHGAARDHRPRCRATLKRSGAASSRRCRSPTTSTPGSTARSTDNLVGAHRRHTTSTSRRWRSTAQRAGHLPTRRSRRELRSTGGSARRARRQRLRRAARADADRRRAQRADLPGRLRQLARARGDRAAGHRARRTSRARAATRCPTRRSASRASTARRRR